jgi:hypothetical protein
VAGLIELVVRVLDVQVRIEGRKELGSLQTIEISADLRSGKDATDFIDERRHFRGEVRILFGRHQKHKEFFADQIIQGLFRPKALTDVFGRGALIDGDVQSAIRYVIEEQGEPMAVFVAEALSLPLR